MKKVSHRENDCVAMANFPGDRLYCFFTICCILIVLLFYSGTNAVRAAENGEKGNLACRPTPYDEIGPFYRPGAPERSKVGTGLVLQGVSRSYPSCRPLQGVKIEFWLVGPSGQYDEQHRGTVYSDEDGRYRIESNFPPPYSGRPPHIHFFITAAGHERLITQFYPKEGTTEAVFDIVLEPAPEAVR
jgi:hypothetical protein